MGHAFQIPLDDWIHDIEAILALQPQAESSTAFLDGVENYFATKYHDHGTRAYRQIRVRAALEWAEKNISELGSLWPEDVETESKPIQLSSKFLNALYGLYSGCPGDHIHDNFPASTIAVYMDEPTSEQDAAQEGS